ncbi:hypothetical protein SAMN04488065_2936 [Haloplanus vescus]|uniref:Protein kinase domain-containing protein n=1 Tax=Haloplanus vescus TaxID=555874 RepID=A0A1H4AV34_9EURY|nr:hypothetical protein [Haloplanus vescus]SEA39678.1 hypothetical protein SAMN04488065_2936 [Haloplanus vescus]
MGQREADDISFGTVEPPPCHQPLEVIERDNRWIIREYYPTEDAIEEQIRTFGTHEDRMDAMRQARTTMERRQYPCLVRWDTHNSVGGLYWNPSFETLIVEYSDLLREWVVVPKDDHFVFQTAGSTSTAFQLGKLVLERFDFKTVEFYTRDGTLETKRDHRFLRNEIAQSGVRFNRGPLPESVEHPAPGSETTAVDGTDDDGEPSTPEDSSMTAISSIAPVVPDITRLQTIDTEGILHQYETPWEGDTAQIWVLDPEFDDHRTALHAFGTAIDDWTDLASHSGVVPIHERDADPSAWVIYDATGTPLSTCREELSMEERLWILTQLADVLQEAQRRSIYRTTLAPSRVIISRAESTRDRSYIDTRLDRSGSARSISARIASPGIERRVRDRLGQRTGSRYMAPEQLQNEAASTTPVYRLGAVTYWLLTGCEPFHDQQAYTNALAAGEITPPQELADLPSGVGDCIQQAMQPDPNDRFRTAKQFAERLVERFHRS